MITLGDQARQQITTLQCNVSPITGFIRHAVPPVLHSYCSPDEARDEQNIALKCYDLLACLIAQSNHPPINSSMPNDFKLTLNFHVIVNNYRLLNKGTGWLNAVHCIKVKSTEKQVEIVC